MNVIRPAGRIVHRMTIEVDEHGQMTLKAEPVMKGVIGMPQTIQPLQIVGFLIKLSSDIMQQLFAGEKIQ